MRQQAFDRHGVSWGEDRTDNEAPPERKRFANLGERRPDSSAEQNRGEDNADGRENENPHHLMTQIMWVKLQASGK